MTVSVGSPSEVSYDVSSLSWDINLGAWCYYLFPPSPPPPPPSPSPPPPPPPPLPSSPPSLLSFLQADQTSVSTRFTLAASPGPFDRSAFISLLHVQFPAVSEIRATVVTDGAGSSSPASYSGRRLTSSTAAEGDVRLESNNAVMIYHSGSWRYVCDDYWGTNDANVVCRQLGLGSATSAPTSLSVQNSFWLDNVACTGSESRLSACSANAWGNENCGTSEGAGAVCALGLASVGSQTSSSGIVVEVTFVTPSASDARTVEIALTSTATADMSATWFGGAYTVTAVSAPTTSADEALLSIGGVGVSTGMIVACAAVLIIIISLALCCCCCCSGCKKQSSNTVTITGPARANHGNVQGPRVGFEMTAAAERRRPPPPSPPPPTAVPIAVPIANSTAFPTAVPTVVPVAVPKAGGAKAPTVPGQSTPPRRPPPPPPYAVASRTTLAGEPKERPLFSSAI